jgi:hypothetical protein
MTLYPRLWSPVVVAPRSLVTKKTMATIQKTTDWLISMRWDYVSELLPLTDILYIPQMIRIGERRWNGADWENWRTRRKTCPSVTLSAINPTWIDPGANPVLRGERPAANRLSHGTASEDHNRHLRRHEDLKPLFIIHSLHHPTNVTRTLQSLPRMSRKSLETPFKHFVYNG